MLKKEGGLSWLLVMKNAQVVRPLTYMTGMVNQHVQLQNEYLAAEKRNPAGLSARQMAAFGLAMAKQFKPSCNRGHHHRAPDSELAAALRERFFLLYAREG